MQSFSSLTPSETLLRLGLALSFIYPPISAIFDPYSWIGYFPAFLSNAFSAHPEILLHSFGVVEVVLALWMLFGKKVRIPSLIAALMLIAIVFFNLGQFPILFRDVALAFAALALAFWPQRSRS
ncbi:MAG: hypothetical protein JWN64_831 [Parcubacteria group bacterium]|nr:hypothetical protein [Parcubacteria group bacterium]